MNHCKHGNSEWGGVKTLTQRLLIRDTVRNRHLLSPLSIVHKVHYANIAVCNTIARRQRPSYHRTWAKRKLKPGYGFLTFYARIIKSKGGMYCVRLSLPKQ